LQRHRWLVLVIGGLVLSYFLRLGFFSFALYAVLGLVLTSRVMGHRGLDGLEHRRRCDVHRASIGERVPVEIQVRHAGRIPLIWLLAEDLLPHGLGRTGGSIRLRSLFPGQEFSLRYSLHCVRRGYYQIGPLLLETGDLFGLARRFEAGEKAHYVTVHPEIVPIGGYRVAAPKAVGEVRVERRIFEDPSRLHGVRAFQPGDKLSRVHWRATARTGELQTKIYEPSAMIGAMVCCDLFEPAYEGSDTFRRSELAVSAAASLAVYITDCHQQVGLLSNGRDAADRARFETIEFEAKTLAQARRMAEMKERSNRLRPCEVPVGRGEVVLRRLLDTTARIELSDFQPVSAMLMREYPRLPRDVSYLVITPRLDRGLVEALAAMRKSGFAASVIRIDHTDPAPALKGALLGAGVRVFDISRSEQLQDLAAVSL